MFEALLAFGAKSRSRLLQWASVFRDCLKSLVWCQEEAFRAQRAQVAFDCWMQKRLAVPCAVAYTPSSSCAVLFFVLVSVPFLPPIAPVPGHSKNVPALM